MSANLKEIPRIGLKAAIQALLSQGGGRINMLSTLQEAHQRLGPVAGQQAGPFLLVHLFGPDANRFVLLDKDNLFSARRPWMQIMGKIFPNGLLLRDGAEHKQHRKIMYEAFKRTPLHDYGGRMGPMIEAGISEWGGASRSAFASYKKLTLTMAAAIFVGAEIGSDTGLMNKAFEDMVAASMSRIRLRIPGLEFYRGLKGREFMLDYLRRLMPAKRATATSDMFSRLCHAVSEDGDRFNDADILDHMVFLMMAAHDTTTSSLTSMTYELGRHPEWQERVRAESQALGKPYVEFEDVERLPTLTLVMKETLRRYPPLPVIPRIATRDFEWEGCRIPEGAMVVVSPIHTHHMPEWWPEPLRFDPERFSPARAEDEKHTHSWVPFGGGHHLCLGFKFAELQIKAVMHQLVSRYRWTIPAEYRMPVQQAPISKPLDGLPLRFDRL